MTTELLDRLRKMRRPCDSPEHNRCGACETCGYGKPGTPICSTCDDTFEILVFSSLWRECPCAKSRSPGDISYLSSICAECFDSTGHSPACSHCGHTNLMPRHFDGPLDAVGGVLRDIRKAGVSINISLAEGKDDWTRNECRIKLYPRGLDEYAIWPDWGHFPEVLFDCIFDNCRALGWEEGEPQ